MRPSKQNISHLAPTCKRSNKHLKLALPFTFPALHALPCTVQPGLVAFTVPTIRKKSAENTPPPFPGWRQRSFNGLACAAELALGQIYALVIIISLLLLPCNTFFCLKKDMLIQL